MSGRRPGGPRRRGTPRPPFEALAGGHVPVLLSEALAALAPREDALYVDGTFGEGGYSEGLLATAHCRVVAIDRDPEAIARGRGAMARHTGRLKLVEGSFGEMDRLVPAIDPAPVAGIALDLGLSSAQLDEAERGFSFRLDGPLDMRMSPHGETAAELVARLPERDLARLIATFGEERYAGRVARAIVAARSRRPIRRTRELAEIVHAAVPEDKGGIDRATRTFQALRIAVNDELGELDRGLAAAERLLAPGGRLAVVAFHSLEDRRVKAFLRERSAGAPRSSRHEPDPRSGPAPSFTLLTRRAVRPSIAEIARNPRARSARLRAAERTAAPAWPAAARANLSRGITGGAL